MSYGLGSFRLQATLHVAGAQLPVLPGSTFTFDRSWAPQGAGQLQLQLEAWDALGLDVATPRLAYLQVELLPYAPSPAGGTMGASTFDAGVFPAVVPDYYRTRDDFTPSAAKRTWQVYVTAARDDAGGHVTTLDVATIELQLQRLRNGGAEWMPTATGPGGGYVLADVWRQMSNYIGVPIPTVWGNYMVGELQPWAPGATAWDFLDAARVAARRSYLIDPATGVVTFSSPTYVADQPLPADWLTSSRDRGDVARFDGLEYADCVVIDWRWTDAAGVEREQTDVAYPAASGITDWRQARKMHRELRNAQPFPGVAQDLADALYRWRSVEVASYALEPYTLHDLRSAAWTTIAYAFDEQPTMTATRIGAA